VYQKVRYEYHLLSLLSFAGAAILNFYDVKWLPLLFTQKKVALKQSLSNEGQNSTLRAAILNRT